MLECVRMVSMARVFYFSFFRFPQPLAEGFG
jgi:hypothetical protein